MTPNEPKSGGHALLLQMIEQNDEKHEAGHKRLRHDLTEGFNEVNTDIYDIRQAQQQDHERLIKQGSQVERRKDISAQKAVVMGAVIGGGFHLIEVLVNAALTLLRHT